MKLLFGRDQTVAEWYAMTAYCDPPIYNAAIGLMDGTQLRGAIIVRAEHRNTANLGLVCERVNFAAIMRQLCAVLFSNFHRIQVRVDPTDPHMRRHVPRLGFTFEGTQKDYFGPGKHALAYYMTADSCRWINGRTKATQAA